MERHGKTLAQAHTLSRGHAQDQLLVRLAANEAVLVTVCNLLNDAIEAKRRITPAGEWLLDNFHLIEEQVRTAKRHLPKNYSRELPRLARGRSKNLPRVYDIALQTIAHGDGRVDPESLSRFVTAYQTVTALQLGELWAIPIMLRLALIENLRRVAVSIGAEIVDRDLAASWADAMREMAEKDRKSLILVIADMARSVPPMTTAFVSEFARRLQGRSAALALPLTWIEQLLSESNSTIEHLVQSEAQKQAAAQVSISNSIASLRFLGAADWSEFVESMSLVERKLLEDPAGAYGQMDFATRDRYRHVIESIARKGSLSERDVAANAILLARRHADRARNDGDRESHVGHYLIDEGRAALAKQCKARVSAPDIVRRWSSRRPLSLYLSTFALTTFVLTALFWNMTREMEIDDWAKLAMSAVAFVAASQLAVALTNWWATILVKPHPLPRMDLSDGIPAALRTLVIVPTVLTNASDIESLTEALEVRFLANRDPNLHFGLLTDFEDAAEERHAGDGPLLRLAETRIAALNRTYGDSETDVFFLFHRPRRWNVKERLWMGFERKRGKLADLNALLRGTAQDRFESIIGRIEILTSVRYVITLDTDTQLPRDAARQFIATLSHPLNRPVYDAQKGRITAGYGILQPRVAISLPGAEDSRYARLFGSEPSIDPYTRAVSDVYQDVFGEGSFIGKGIYNVDAFEATLKDRFPENRILSHDLLEGCYARSALVSDVQLLEAYPSRYDADVSRRHRWIRGDWQIASWLLPRAPSGGTHASANDRPETLSTLSKWKILDNLRRSLVPAALMLLLLSGWLLLPSVWTWTLAVIGIIFVPSLIAASLGAFRRPNGVPFRAHLFDEMRLAGERFAQALLTLACLPYEAHFSLDAIVRTNWRVLVSHKRMLQWTPSSNADRAYRTGLLAYHRTMWIAPTIAVLTAIYLTSSNPAAMTVAGPILLLWLLVPAIAWRISQPLSQREVRLGIGQFDFLRKIARKTWAYFEVLVSADDHWLPPDNYQEHPVAVVAHRTSPTNMGLALLANLSAHDFGYISGGVFVDRTTKAFDTMARLVRHRGHFYNWYDTQTLQPMAPLYVSSVDSGNLAGHLLTLRPGLLSLIDQEILTPRWIEGLVDTFRVLIDIAGSSTPATQARFDRMDEELESAARSKPMRLTATWICLNRLMISATGLKEHFDALPDPDTTGLTNPRWWARTLVNQCQQSLDELTQFAPWLGSAFPSERLRSILDTTPLPTLRDVANQRMNSFSKIEHQLVPAASSSELAWLSNFQQSVLAVSERATQAMHDIESLAKRAHEFAQMDYDFLYDEKRHLLAIGYNVGERRQDPSCYDILASESRLSTFVAIAQSRIPKESWFALGRLLTPTAGKPTLLSWSGSMFEYLMPLLVMPTYANTLLDSTYRAAVSRQILYGSQLGVPWGISECGYNTVDAARNYQYRAFGVPSLGIKRGLVDDLVIAPYASALALMITPEAACANLQRLAGLGMIGQFGFYEAIDYTPSRLPTGQASAVIRSFMVHHQGMIILSLAYLLLGRPMQRRFESDPMIQATTLLLQERVPKIGATQWHNTEYSSVQATANDKQMPVRVITGASTPIPEVQLLSNSQYYVMVTNAGAGYSRWKDLSVTRWREDTTRDHWGTFLYIRDTKSGTFWSNTHQPTGKRADTYEAIFTEGRAEFRRSDLDYDTYTEMVVSPEDDVELRRVRITNRARARRTIELTSYAEVVLTTPAADALHPAFSNLFVETEIVRPRRAILCTRRPRSMSERSPWMFHLMAVRGADIAEISYETDRMRFIGRGRTIAAPSAMDDATALSGNEGSVLDPIVAIRYRITLDPEQTATFDVVTGIGESRDVALGLIEKHQDRQLADRVFEMAWTHSQVVLRQINATEADAQLYSRLANSLIYANGSLRADSNVLKKNRRGQSGLWGYAISGDFPMVLLQIAEPSGIELIRQLVQAHAYWRLKGLVVDLVIWNENRGGYRQVLQEQILGLIAAGVEAHVIDRPGGIFVRSTEHISEEDRHLFESVARVIISDRRGSLSEQINRDDELEVRPPHLSMPRFKSTRTYRAAATTNDNAQPDKLLSDNGLGGFTADASEYVITTTPEQVTPTPWVNVLANAHFGTVISESGMAYTWNENAHEFRLTPWHNDPVTDSGGEAFYLRDEETGHFWSPTPSPCRGPLPYVSRHGFGYSVFTHEEDGIHSELTVYVALDDAIKFSLLKLRNESGRNRRLSVTGYLQWVLGDVEQKTSMHVTTEIDPVSGAFCARNAYSAEFGHRVAFFDVDDPLRTHTGDRTEFLGRNGQLSHPMAMRRSQLSNEVGAGMDPCAAIQVVIDLADGEERECVFRLGAAENYDEARALLQRARGSAAAHQALTEVRQFWQQTLGAIQVQTPDASIDAFANGWLLYQTLACRVWARSGYYQSGGAFGFRDQLQDVMALIHAKPQLVREHIVLCASRQFQEGDVQHWWHPPIGRGVRTHCSDDFLWLPLATCRYVLVTRDTAVLNESIHFLSGRQVDAAEDSLYDLPSRSEEAASLYLHCVRAIERGLSFGEHGLPLIGSGDWNDGMNAVGKEGKGESIWLGFFLCEVLMQFSELARSQGDVAFADRCMTQRATLIRNIEKHGWDGDWYRRAYFDNGSPLGSASNTECQIDSIAQSWSVLSGVAGSERARKAMDALEQRLVRGKEGIIQLLDPPFDHSDMDPGYIRGYVPGVRENGGQYTHAAIWAAMAFAALGDHRRAWMLTHMINPSSHTSSSEDIAIYKVEPYVVAADVYAVAPHTGRGGWSWYTGSAGWMYRLIVESLLGLRVEGDRLYLTPCLPADWPGYTMQYRHLDTNYHIAVSQTPSSAHHRAGERSVTVDGALQTEAVVSLIYDRHEHVVEIIVYSAAS